MTTYLPNPVREMNTISRVFPQLRRYLPGNQSVVTLVGMATPDEPSHVEGP